jgi:glutathione-specific gamma-glutamylcyclotransferase
MASMSRSTEPETRWVFGYGSLIWHPGFEFLQSQQAVLHGAHRSLCIYSHRHRGTPDAPGLVFGLMQGGSCRGMAFGVAGDDWPRVYDYLIAREQDTGVYREAIRPVRLSGGGTVRALAFLVDETHVQFAGRLDVGEQVRMVREGFGQSGANIDYVLNTALHLAEMGIRDRHLTELVALLRQRGNASA